ncbi:MAG: 1-acyl-sn-glycerol-3-phosphate acyltransferase [Spirochaetes bacterium]|nr:1-acyl-sn-glycerol-3-phosphate acyltransferase [Spirochaetota bacterium]
MEKTGNVLFLEEFREIAPYRGDDFHAAFERIKKSKTLVNWLRKSAFRKAPSVFNPFLNLAAKIYLKFKFKKIKNPDDFNLFFIKSVITPVVKKTVQEITFSGLEKLDPKKHYLYISNHRDIVIDPALTFYAFEKCNMPTSEVAFGNNLLINDLISDIMRSNKGLVVKRGQSPREQLHSTIILSKWIWYTLNTHDSVWLAQREGRAKNGDDTTNPALVKMLYLSQRKGGLEFSDFINKLNIVPLVISYELDPCDRLKARELCRRDTTGKYKKRKNEDFLNMIHGITIFRGRVHIAFGEALKGTWTDHNDVANALDAFIQTNYKLWSSNYAAYDILHSTNKYSSKYDAEYKDAFVKRFDRLSQEVKAYAYAAYAKPVENAEKYQQQ